MFLNDVSLKSLCVWSSVFMRSGRLKTEPQATLFRLPFVAFVSFCKKPIRNL